MFKDVLAASESRATALQHSLEAAEKDLDDRETEILRLEGLLNVGAKKEKELEDDLAALSAKVAEHASRNTELQTRLEAGPAAAPSAELVTLRTELETVRAELEALQAQHSSAEAAAATSKARSDELEEALRTRSADLTAALGALLISFARQTKFAR